MLQGSQEDTPSCRGRELFQSRGLRQSKGELPQRGAAGPAERTRIRKNRSDVAGGRSPLRAAAFLAKANELAPKNDQNRIRLARCYLAIGRFADANKEALKVLEQTPDNGDAIIALTEAARSKEDIQAAEQQLEKYPKKDDVSFHLASANLFLQQWQLDCGRKLPPARR